MWLQIIVTALHPMCKAGNCRAYNAVFDWAQDQLLFFCWSVNVFISLHRNESLYCLMQQEMQTYTVPLSEQFHLRNTEFTRLSFISSSVHCSLLGVRLHYRASWVDWLQLQHPWRRHFCVLCLNSTKSVNYTALLTSDPAFSRLTSSTCYQRTRIFLLL